MWTGRRIDMKLCFLIALRVQGPLGFMSASSVHKLIAISC